MLPNQPEFIFAGVLMKQLLAGTDTSNAFCLFENKSEGRSGTPIHIHANEDETFYVLEGEMQVFIEGTPRTVKAGEVAFLPRNIPHQLMNTSGQPARYLNLCVPSGFESFVAKGGRPRMPGEMPSPPTEEEIIRMKEVAPLFGLTLLPNWETLPLNSNSTSSRRSEMMTSDSEKRAIADRFLKTLQTQDWVAMRDIFADNAVWNLPGSNKISGLAEGADAVVGRARLIASYGLNFALKHVLIGPAGVALSLNNTARRGDLVLDEYLSTVCQIRDGKISRIDTYLSDVAMMDAFFV